MAWPDPEVGFMELLAGLGTTTLRLSPTWTQPFDEYQPGVDPEPTPVINVYQVGEPAGDEIGRTQRITVVVYAASRDSARAVADSARDLLLKSPHTTSTGLLDSVRVEVGPVPIPFTHDRIVYRQATYRVDTRPNI